MLLLSFLHLKPGVNLASILVIHFCFPSPVTVLISHFTNVLHSPSSSPTTTKCVFTQSSQVNRGLTLLHSIRSTSPAHVNQPLTSFFLKLYFTPSSPVSSSLSSSPSSSLSSSLSLIFFLICPFACIVQTIFVRIKEFLNGIGGIIYISLCTSIQILCIQCNKFKFNN